MGSEYLAECKINSGVISTSDDIKYVLFKSGAPNLRQLDQLTFTFFNVSAGYRPSRNKTLT